MLYSIDLDMQKHCDPACANIWMFTLEMIVSLPPDLIYPTASDDNRFSDLWECHKLMDG